MSNTRGLLYPALHKFYNALSSLAKFEKGTDFFDNINHLDNFFSEYRNITFVLQKSLAHTPFETTYEQLRDQYLVNDIGKWFKDKRNEVLKQQPFNLEKRIVITIYSGQQSLELPELIFTIDNDIKYSTIVESLKATFLSFGQLEIMFSAEFFFYEHGHTEDLFDNFIFGIGQMKLFLAAMKRTVNGDCELCNELQNKIENIKFYRVPKDMLLVDDYVFYTRKSTFEKASRVALTTGPGQARSKLDTFNKTYPNGDLFQKFELMHLVIFQMQKSLLPTCMVVYEDNTFELLTFGFSIKTTVYRKFNEIAKRITTEGISQVLFVTEMYVYDVSDFERLDSHDRIEHAQKEILSFFTIDKELKVKSRSYDTERIDDLDYIASVMAQPSGKVSLPGFMYPVGEQFVKLQKQSVNPTR